MIFLLDFSSGIFDIIGIFFWDFKVVKLYFFRDYYFFFWIFFVKNGIFNIIDIFLCYIFFWIFISLVFCFIVQNIFFSLVFYFDSSYKYLLSYKKIKLSLILFFFPSYSIPIPHMVFFLNFVLSLFYSLILYQYTHPIHKIIKIN